MAKLECPECGRAYEQVKDEQAYCNKTLCLKRGRPRKMEVKK